jgi:FtsP/CotA-like multicopper oxidase with cupredoxin domain
MAAVDPDLIDYTAPDHAVGGQVLSPRTTAGVKEYDLMVSVISWPILAGQRMGAYAINGQVPAPTLRVDQGDRVRINATNELPESTTLHWHGLVLPNETDGPAHIT